MSFIIPSLDELTPFFFIFFSNEKRNGDTFIEKLDVEEEAKNKMNKKTIGTVFEKEKVKRREDIRKKGLRTFSPPSNSHF